MFFLVSISLLPCLLHTASSLFLWLWLFSSYFWLGLSLLLFSLQLIEMKIVFKLETPTLRLGEFGLIFWLSGSFGIGFNFKVLWVPRFVLWGSGLGLKANLVQQNRERVSSDRPLRVLHFFFGSLLPFLNVVVLEIDNSTLSHAIIMQSFQVDVVIASRFEWIYEIVT